ncbi:MAG: hypothetical protein OXE94_09435 [Aestuariivita sp.]|nr:hypothetical protein [Aestuariivita sp.]
MGDNEIIGKAIFSLVLAIGIGLTVGPRMDWAHDNLTPSHITLSSDPTSNYC